MKLRVILPLRGITVALDVGTARCPTYLLPSPPTPTPASCFPACPMPARPHLTNPSFLPTCPAMPSFTCLVQLL